jgi:DNA polymerase III alpha subunit (gram-positive type)
VAGLAGLAGLALSLSEGGRQLRELLRDYTEGGKVKLTPIGHGIAFDVQFLQHHLLNKNEMNKYVSYRPVDTANIAKFLQLQGKIPNTVSGSLSSLVQHFNLQEKLSGRAHTADYDVKASILILQEMLRL